MQTSNEFSRSKERFIGWLLLPTIVVSIILLVHLVTSTLPWPTVRSTITTSVSVHRRPAPMVSMRLPNPLQASVLINNLHVFGDYTSKTYQFMYDTVKNYIKLQVNSALEAARLRLLVWLRVDEVFPPRLPP